MYPCQLPIEGLHIRDHPGFREYEAGLLEEAVEIVRPGTRRIWIDTP